MASSATLKRLEALPMEAALEFWRKRLAVPKAELAAIADAVRELAFTVAGLALQDELQTVKDALDTAIEEGSTFEDFVGDIEEILARRGWTAWRAETIFRTNIQTAYNVGRYREMQVAAPIRPYWRYQAVNDGRTRPAHRALDGKVFPADHPFWDTWYPPNGYNCRCTVVSLSAAEIEREGLAVETIDPTGQLIPITDHAGRVQPPEILEPDAGWGTNPAKTQWGAAA